MFHLDDRRCVPSHNKSLSTSLNATLLHHHGWNPPGALIPSVQANQSVETNGEDFLTSEEAAGAVLSKANSHLLSLSLTPLSAPPYEPWPSSPQEGKGWLSRLCSVISMFQLWSKLGQNLACVYLKTSPLLCVSAWGNYGSASSPNRDDMVE